MRNYKVIALRQVNDDLSEGKKFYDFNEIGIGDYFYDSILSDIESLKLYAGIHRKQLGFYRMLSKRFPFAIYYDIKDSIVIVMAVLDLRRDPAWIRKKLGQRFC